MEDRPARPGPAARFWEILAMAYFAFFPSLGAVLISGLLFTALGTAIIPYDIPWSIPIIVSALAIGLGLLPNTFVALLFGFAWGLPSAVGFIIGYALAVMLGYGVARILPGRLIRNLVEARPKWKAGFENLKDEGLKTVILLRLSPIFPFGITNLVLSWLGFRFWKTLLGSLIGMLPRALLLIYLGSQASKLAEAMRAGSNLGMFGLAAGLTVLALYGLYRLWNSSKAKRSE